MSSIWMDAPTVQINADGLDNLTNFIFSHEPSLKQFGGIKIQLNSDCLLGLKKRQILPSCIITQQVTKVTEDELIYSVHKCKDVNICSNQRTSIPNEATFWSSLSRSDHKGQHSTVSILPNRSFFYQKSHRKYFNIHNLPKQSLLKLGGNKVTDEFVPCLRRSHVPGAIFPLGCARQRLFLLDYHHQAGDRHWYIIPSCERQNLLNIIKRENSSFCLEHEDLFIDPSVLDKHHIRYHRIIQYPNEFVVLSAGALSQSFMKDAGWNESINFALPSWIEEGHANAHILSCQCNIINDTSLPQTIDLTLFKYKRIQKYIDTHLNIIINQSLTKVETIFSTNLKPVLLLHQIEPTLYGISSPIIVSSIDTSLNDQDEKIDDQNNSQQQLELLNELFKTQENQSYQSVRLTNPQLDPENNNKIDNDLSSFDHLMDMIFLTPTTNLSTDSEINELINLYDANSTQHIDDLSPIENEPTTENTFNRNSNKKVNDLKTLFVSGLRNDVKKIDLRHHFLGSTKITFKQCQTVSNLKYAFVSHKTSKEAQQNLLRPIDTILFGLECHVEYAYDHSHISNRHRTYDNRTIVVNKIPSNVTENDLRRLFNNAYLSKYSPARIIHRTATTVANITKTKVLWGYAFLLYNDNQQAANVIEHTDKYHINGQPLTISYYRNTKQSHTTNK